jgi:hypothetical protein
MVQTATIYREVNLCQEPSYSSYLKLNKPQYLIFLPVSATLHEGYQNINKLWNYGLHNLNNKCSAGYGYVQRDFKYSRKC